MKNVTLPNNKVSVIVPIYNELKSIEKLLIRLADTLTATKHPFEIIFVDDYSTDGSFEYLVRFSKSQVIKVLRKKGQFGKAYSLTQGFAAATGEIFVMIDGDLQYPPEAILEMLPLLEKADIVIANRKHYRDSLFRKILNFGFRTILGRVLFGLPYDIQSGLKVFKREVFNTVKFSPHSPWTFDLEFLHKSKGAGFVISQFDIVFYPRVNGESKVSLIKTTFEIGLNALYVRLKKIHPQNIEPNHASSMLGAGIGHKKVKYITHTTLPYQQSALYTLTVFQKVFIVALVASVCVGLYFSLLVTVIWVLGILSTIYFIDVLFNLYLVLRSIHGTHEISFSADEMKSIEDEKLPTYSILCPLYREARMIPQFLEAISKIDWPKRKLEVIILLEQDDRETIAAVERLWLPSYVRAVIVPDSLPKTKPKACNYGLLMARGEYVVVYDAEDIPDPLQLKKAYSAFQKVSPRVICLQAKLNYYNPHQNALTRFFTAEYSLWFDIMLPGLQAINTSIPLGGTSNHFRTADLIQLKAWDSFNVTEDADLGVRLFKEGYQTVMIDSTTYEEANSNIANWMRQRSRWIKGYMQTYLVHMREVYSFVSKKGFHGFIFQLIVGGKISFILINPILWLATFSYFAFYSLVGPSIEQLYPSIVFYFAVTSLVFGNFLFIYYYMIGCVKRGQFSLVKYVFLVPFYWLMISIAALIALFQLIFKPHYWEKTIHGFHLGKKASADIVVGAIETEGIKLPKSFRGSAVAFAFRQHLVGGAILVGASIFGNILNLLFNVYLGRTIDVADYGMVSLVSGFLYLVLIFLGGLHTTVTYKSGFLNTHQGEETVQHFRSFIRRRSLLFGAIFSLIWVVLSPFMMRYFNVGDVFPFITFAPVLLVGFALFSDKGVLSGKLMLGMLAGLVLFEPIVKLLSAYIFIQLSLSSLSYVSIPLSLVATFVLGSFMFRKNEAGLQSAKNAKRAFSFPKKFFFAATLSGLSSMAFLSLDIILAKHYLSSNDAGIYALASLVGKVIFFLGSISTQFIVPIVGRNDGVSKDSEDDFYRILFLTCILTTLGFILFGIFGELTLPYLFGDKAALIIPFVMLFSYGALCFAVSRVFVQYYLVKRVYTFPAVASALTIIQFIIIRMHHESVSSFVLAMVITGIINMVFLGVLHIFIDYVKVVERNVASLFDLLFMDEINGNRNQKNLRILIFNWRDISHKWAGGAEVYIHEIAKRWIKEGNSVTLFCGNDGYSSSSEKIQGIQVIRRGGFYLVYFWAFLYYIFRFRGKYDVIIDCENGIPFFTPLFARKPIFLVIHHVHQKVLREHLKFPLSAVAMFLEGKIMPFIYKDNTVITVSESSKIEILKKKLVLSSEIKVIHPGVDRTIFEKGEKTSYPSFLYLGRIRPYKNVDVAIQAFAGVVKLYPEARLSIVGEGDFSELKDQTIELKVDTSVRFLGKVSEREKARLLSQSWVVVQPSDIEGWGITVIEANASGTPVIASNVNGLKDSVVDGTTGVLVEVKNYEKLSSAMIDFIIDKKYRELLSKQAYIWAQNFNWDASALNFYHVIIDSLEEKYRYGITGEVALQKS